MRRTLLLSLLPLLPLAALSGCKMNVARADARRGDAAQPGPAGTRSFALAGFSKVALKGSDDVVVTIGPSFAVGARGPQDVLDRLELTIAGDTLQIGRKGAAAGWSDARGHATVGVTLPALAAVELAGSGDMRVGTVRAPAFDASVAGSGNLELAGLAVGRASLRMAGSGDLEATGTTRTGDYAVAGSGNIKAATLAADTLSLNVAGSGGVAASARARADVAVSGSGDVTVTGGAHCTISKMGSGDVTCG